MGAEEFAAFVLHHLREESVLLRPGARLVPISGKSTTIACLNR